MTDFKKGDRVRIVGPGHMFNGKVWVGREECRPGDLGTFNCLGSDGKGAYIDLDIQREAGVRTAYVDLAGLEKVEPTPVVDFAAGREPSTGEQYLDRAADWLTDNSDDTCDVFVQDVLAVANFLREVDSSR